MKTKLKPPIVPAYAPIPEISLESLLKIIEDESGLCVSRVCGSGEHTVLVLPDVKQEIFTFFKCGKGPLAVNIEEQKAELYGNRFVNNENGKLIFLLSRAAYIYPAVRSRTYVATSQSNEDDFMEYRLQLEQNVVNKYEAQYNTGTDGRVINVGVKYFGPSDTVGNIHTHPGMRCEFSSIDYSSNESIAARPNAYLVCNPIDMDFNAMVGTESEPAKIMFLDTIVEEDASEKISEKEPSSRSGIDSVSGFAEVCKNFLNMPDVKGRLHMNCGSRGTKRIRFSATLVPDDARRRFLF